MTGSSSRSICGAQKRNGEPCRHAPGAGTDHLGFGYCKWHTGSTPGGRRYAARLIARGETATLVDELDIDPHEALLMIMRTAALQVGFFARQVATLEGDVLSAGGSDLHPYVLAHQAALERTARLAKLAIDAGVAERQVRLAEVLGDQMATFLTALLDDLELTPAQRHRAPSIVRRHLLALEEGGPAGSTTRQSD
jgi:hypothetical protein